MHSLKLIEQVMPILQFRRRILGRRVPTASIDEEQVVRDALFCSIDQRFRARVGSEFEGFIHRICAPEFWFRDIEDRLNVLKLGI